MSLFISARTAAERALRKVGAYSTADSAADTEELRETLYWLDFVVASLSGVDKLFWLVQNDITITLSANTTNYAIETSMGTSVPDDGVMFITHATLRNSSGLDTPLRMVSRTEYEALEDKDETGTPWGVYIDRLDDMSMKVLGVPTTTGYSIVLTVISYAPNMLTRSGANSLGFSSEWNLFLITATAAEIGDGPVRRLPVTEIESWRKQADLLRKGLLARANREFRGTDVKRTAPWGV